MPKTRRTAVATARKKAAPARKSAVPAPAQEARADDRAAALRRAAFQCFAEAGFHETTVDDICRKAGVSKGTFYWYFESKELVFVQILEAWADEVEGEIRTQFTDAFKDQDPLPALLLALGREGRRGRRLLPVWLDALVQSQRHPQLQKAMSKFLRRMRAAMAHMVQPSFREFYGEDAIDTMAGLLLACFIGSIAQDMAAPGGRLYDEQSRTLLVTLEHFGRLLAKSREPTRRSS
jgi:AcrR family transcriptional regulator